jgi:sugar fermentation stimulation protein A
MIQGIFKYECKHRFLAIVEINNIETECYMPTSSKLKNFIDLTDKTVYLIPNLEKNSRTKYTVHATLINNTYILLNLNYLNNLYFEKVLNCNINYLPEKTISSNLKVDFFSTLNNQLIEIKGIITDRSYSTFPYISSKRIIRQLDEFSKLDYNITLVLILMNPKINTIYLDINNKNFYNAFINCISKINLDIYSYEFTSNLEKLNKRTYILTDNIIKIKDKN